MAAALIRKQWQVANNGGWSETFLFWSPGLGTPDLIDGCTAQLSLIRPGRPTGEALVYASTDPSPYLTIGANELTLDVPRTVTAAWTPGTYDVQLRVFGAGADYDRYNLVGPQRLNVLEAPGT